MNQQQLNEIVETLQTEADVQYRNIIGVQKSFGRHDYEFEDISIHMYNSSVDGMNTVLKYIARTESLSFVEVVKGFQQEKQDNHSTLTHSLEDMSSFE